MPVVSPGIGGFTAISRNTDSRRHRNIADGKELDCAAAGSATVYERTAATAATDRSARRAELCQVHTTVSQTDVSRLIHSAAAVSAKSAA